MTHRCPVQLCTRQVADELLLCSFHYGRVPRELQRELNRTYSWKQRTEAAPASLEHLRVWQRAVDSVNRSFELDRSVET
jgi:hypothetical protein